MTAGDSVQRPRFRKRTAPEPAPKDPESLFGELPRSRRGVGALWSHQADLLRTYAEDKHVASPDLALELPTGSGKTLVGLLIADWRRRSMRHRVVYACLTNQLASQVGDAADENSIPVVLLTGKARDWTDLDVNLYASSKAVAVTVYSHIFNTNPALHDAQALLFDDAHAGENYVAEAWALEINYEDPVYCDLLDEVRADLGPHLVARMTGEVEDAGSTDEVRLLPVAVISRHVQGIDKVLAAGLSGKEAYRFKMIREGLRSCLFYLSLDCWYIRPMIPPTFDHDAFTSPEQRIYLSATMGDAGELERAFGRENIDRIPVPPAWERTGAGRRFFLFPALAQLEASEFEDADDLIGEVLAMSPKHLVLTPDKSRTTKIADLFEIPAEERFTAKDSDAGLRPFLEADRGTLLAPGRYDGMDLPGDSCRLILMSGLPDATHLQDKFLATRLHARSVLDERVRTRLVQGAGRCTRGPVDSALVIVDGDRLLRYLSREDVRAAMPADLQAEVGFGLDNANVPARDFLQLAESAFIQDEVWQEDAEPEIADRRREARKTAPPDARELAATASEEVRAWQAAWQGDWEAATRAAIRVLERLTAHGLRPYRALWAYLASAWSSLAADAGQLGAAERAASLLQRANEAAQGTWLRELQWLPTADNTDQLIDEIDSGAAGGVIAALAGPFRSASSMDKKTSAMLSGLSQASASVYEQALVTLGMLLGAESTKQPGQGRADAAWVWPQMWVTLEAKTEQDLAGMISMECIRQADTQLASLAGDRGEDPPEGSFSLIVSPRTVVDPDAMPIAHENLYLVAPDVIGDIAHDVVRAWGELRGSALGAGQDVQRAATARVLWQHRVLPTQIKDRLAGDSIRGQ